MAVTRAINWLRHCNLEFIRQNWAALGGSPDFFFFISHAVIKIYRLVLSHWLLQVLLHSFRAKFVSWTSRFGFQFESCRALLWCWFDRYLLRMYSYNNRKHMYSARAQMMSRTLRKLRRGMKINEAFVIETKLNLNVSEALANLSCESNPHFSQLVVIISFQPLASYFLRATWAISTKRRCTAFYPSNLFPSERNLVAICLEHAQN